MRIASDNVIGEEAFEISPELRAALLESIAQCERGETISAGMSYFGRCEVANEKLRGYSTSISIPPTPDAMRLYSAAVTYAPMKPIRP